MKSKMKKNEVKPKNPGGRPTDYNLKLAEEICEAIASSNKGLRRLCDENKKWPDRRNIYKWLIKYEEFRHLYMQAKETQVEFLVDEILEIADDISHDNVIRTDANGNERQGCNTEWINRSRLKIDTRKWLAAKLCPRIYGERVLHDGGINITKHEDALKELE